MSGSSIQDTAASSEPSAQSSSSVCANVSHLFDFDDIRDRHWTVDPTNPNSYDWQTCAQYVCPNRNHIPLGEPGRASWACTPDPAQINLVAKRNEILSKRAERRKAKKAAASASFFSDTEERESRKPPAQPPTHSPPPPPLAPTPAPEDPQLSDSTGDPPSDPDNDPPPDPLTTTAPLPKKRRNMADIVRAFQAVPSLKDDGSNYRIWVERVTFTALGCGVKALLSGPESTGDADKERERDALLACLMGKLPDSIFITMKSLTEPHTVMANLYSRFGQHTAITEAHTEERLFSLKCTNASAKSMLAHLDELLTLKDQLSAAGITIDDRTFSNAIISSVPSAY
ncbi:hypothetical protein BXZ70DRAFT_1006809 [Cristinia sonorae]|uniref:Uncharacterized protein n=1 Tax=Cristinia sonorae TaxID=1940300 RepID=A0A8K0UR56_9AGAR|nr:hypothetical protein BXZ70DRAFT_1006809 [Cristinia sonorae]